MKQPTLLYEDRALLVVVKPFGMPSQSDHSTAMDMVSYLKNMLARRNKIQNPYIAVVHRLDRPVGGVMVYAKTQKAAAALSRQFSTGQTQKEYLAVIYGKMEEAEGTLKDTLVKDPHANVSRVMDSFKSADASEPGKSSKKSSFADAKEAVLQYQMMQTIVWEGEEFSLLKIRLLTGRHHQIRVQFANAGFPIVGDRKYAGTKNAQAQERKIPSGLGLFSCSLEFDHPESGKRMRFEAQPTEGPFRLFEQFRPV